RWCPYEPPRRGSAGAIAGRGAEHPTRRIRDGLWRVHGHADSRQRRVPRHRTRQGPTAEPRPTTPGARRGGCGAMSINLAYDDTVSRVRITATGLAVSTYRVERSTNGLFWRTVRGAVSLTPQSGEIKVDDYEFAADVENFYRVLDLDESPEP